jgi:hypothetical protein
MLVMVGGHSRNIGKTSVVEGVIRALPDAGWTAVKITQYGHDVCSADGDSCDCAAGDDHPYALTEERQAGPSDSGRFLAAGARRAFWLRTARGELGHAVPALRKIVASSENVIFESNSAMQFFTPDLYIALLDPAVADMKESTRRYFDRVSAFVVIDRGAAPFPWEGVPRRWLQGKPRFLARPPVYVGEEMSAWLRASMGNRSTIATKSAGSV